MKNLVLFLMLVMISVPCIAQQMEFEPPGLSSIDGTLWAFPRTPIYVGFYEREVYIGNYEDEMYPITVRDGEGNYVDLAFVVLFRFGWYPTLSEKYVVTGWLFPLGGVGFSQFCISNEAYPRVCDRSSMNKVRDNWIPSPWYDY